MQPISRKDFDTRVRPQDDFYRYVNGGWFDRNTIPATENRWGAFHVLNQKNRKQLHTILTELTKKKPARGSDAQKVRDMYGTAMDMRKRNAQGTTYLQPGFDVITTFSEAKDIPQVFGFLHAHEVGAPWQLWVDQDDKNSKRMVLRIGQGGIGVPNRDYHVKKDAESKRIRDAYSRYIVAQLQNTGMTSSAAKQSRDTILRIEKKLAQASRTPLESRDVHALYNKYTVKSLQATYPQIPWKQYLDALGVPSKARSHIIVDVPEFLDAVCALLDTLSATEWQTYLHWHFLDAYAGTLGQNYIDTRFVYTGRAIQGLTKNPERWKRAVGVTTGLLPDAVGKLYVQKHFPPSAKRAVKKLTENLIAAYRERLTELDWMQPKTKKAALQKLDTMSVQIGYPDKWKSYAALTITNESFTKNVMAAVRFSFDYEIGLLAKPTDPTEWFIPASTVNAFYSPNLNQITFPAGILQPPFFYPDADPAINYGAIGAVIGHELTHGFDDKGSLFDAQGNLKNWWTQKDREAFEKRAKRLERQFDQYRVVDGLRVNGALTLGENIADLGGLVIAYTAFTRATKNAPAKRIDGLTPEQRFFVSHALTERCLTRDAFLKLQVVNDVHAPSEFRSNGPVSNCDAFYEAFDVRKGDALYRAPHQRVRIW